MPTTVHCTKLKRDLEGFDKPPWPGALGERIQREISQEAWQLWLKYAVRLINEYRLNLATAQAQAFLSEQMEQFLADATRGIVR